MALVIAHPFRLAGSQVAVVEDGSDAGVAQEIAVLVSTRPGERPLVPSYGVTDPAFDGLHVAEVNAGLALYGPPGVTVSGIDVDALDPRTQRAVLTYDVD